MRDNIFYCISIGFVLGVLLRSFFIFNIFHFLFISFLALVFVLYFSFFSGNKKVLIGVLFVTIFLFVGIWRFGVSERQYPSYLENNLLQKVTLEGVVIDEVEKREFNLKAIIEVKNKKEKTNILLSLPFGTEASYGDRLRISGKLEKPENFTTPQGKLFDYISYLKKDNILYIIKNPQVEILAHSEASIIKEKLFKFKNLFLSRIEYAVPSPENLLLGGLILGERASFGEAMRQKFIDTGTIHIIALSGYNVTIIAEWIIDFFKFLPSVFAFYLGVLGIVLFVVMSGLQATAIRAGIMAILALVARAYGKDYQVGRALVLAGLLMVLFNPYVLVYDVSFQLSFIATVAVIYIAPLMNKYFLWVPEKFGLRDVVSVTFSAYIFVLPFVIYKMGNLSLVSLPANILILPFIPPTMVLGFFTGFVGLFWKILALPSGFIAYILLHYELWVIEIFSKFPLASLTIPDMHISIMILCYLSFLYFYLKNK
jgi:competence protein ComEC